jgi:DNA topoisomerase-1
MKFPGFLAVYEEGLDDSDGEDGAILPAMTVGDTPFKHAAEKTQHFTQPPPRFSEATLVKRLEELGIGRPSTYASTIQVLKDRAYVRVEKNRFFAEESGRLLTAFLERFFERYVAYDYTAGLEDQLDEISGGRADWQSFLEAFWRDFKPKTVEVMEQKPSEVTAELDIFLSPYLFPEREDGTDPRLCPKCGEGRLALRGGKFGAFVACSNYPDCKYTRKFAQPGGESGDDTGPEVLGQHPETQVEVSRKSGRFGPYFEMGEGADVKRASIPQDIPAEDIGLEWAVKLLSLPRTVGIHPESGEPVTASIGRYGPYLAHNGKYARLQSTTEVFETGMNSAVVKLAEALANPARGRGAARAPLKEFGKHPRTDAEIKLMEGRFGPYVTDGTTNATVPKSISPSELTLEEAAQLIDARAAMPSKGKVKKKAAVKAKPAAKAKTKTTK